MRMQRIWLVMMLILFAPALVQAKTVLASGAGYRSVVDDLTDAYTHETGNEIERIYGNMARIVAQARSSGNVDLLLGDVIFLEQAKLPFIAKQVLGHGRLVAAFPKGSSFNGIQDFLAPEVKRIAIPDTTRAIYGKAALQYIQNKRVYEEVQPKIMMVATVPQAASYVIAGEVDFALINLTHARKIKDSIGGYTIIDEKAYSPIKIIIGQLETKSGTLSSETFLQFLRSDTAQEIIARHGM
ncbi:molybdate ABC transporter substrate-binding protein [Desulfogranum marinum]|uniref:molybdate ABC transporter substrate-binding protein n=1 Tax=Desulfogranum marinum TaxID=453220 RepID=UPI0019640B4B|nr:molybdate ABC transporter substrate-binding protein [Desulfogranum marinum]MBM9510990.1 molybdate ABC transporter substrate-binding protein [Desulfogranum marinum]